MSVLLLSAAMALALAAAAFCAGTETGLLSVSRGRVLHMARQGGVRAKVSVVDARGATYPCDAVWREDDFRGVATYEKPHAFSTGMEHVFVNGVLSYTKGRFAARAGRFLERRGGL